MQLALLLGSVVAALVSLTSSATAHAQCGTWSEGFAAGLRTTTALTTFDAGTGELVYVATNPAGTTFTNFYQRIQRWTGARWELVYESPLVPSGWVISDLARGDDGAGPALFALEARPPSGGNPHVLRRWDGTTWTQIALFDSYAQIEFVDDGTGPRLLAYGEFNLVNGAPLAHLARWDGVAWSAYGTGPGSAVRAVAAFDEGAGVRLCAIKATNPPVVRFDGANWTAVGSGMTGTGVALHGFDDGSGPVLIASGLFQITGPPSVNLVRWNGSTWSPISGTFGQIRSFLVGDLGAGPQLFAGGQQTHATSGRYVSVYSGGVFVPVGLGTDDQVYALALQHVPGGARLWALGAFEFAEGRGAVELASWDGASWSGLGAGFDASVYGLAAFDAGGGPELVACGVFRYPGTSPVSTKATRWNGSVWSNLATGIQSSDVPLALASIEVAGVTSLYLGGALQNIGGVGRSNGTAWQTLGGGLHGNAHALTGFDDGSGSKLVVGGNFGVASGGPGEFVAAWNGSAWSTLGSGTNDVVAALATFDEGAGARLFAGGQFTLAGGVSTGTVARWDGSAWSVVGGGVTGGVNVLCVFDGALYAGGALTNAGGVPVSYLARWDGSAWSDVPGGGANGAVLALALHDDGRGSALYVGGGFDVIGGITAYNLARFDGASWEAVDGGLDGVVRALASVDDDGDGDAELFAGGDFLNTATLASSRIARFEGCPHYASFCFGDGTLADHTTPCPCGNDGAPGRGCASGSNANGAALTASGATQNDNVVLAADGMPLTAFGIYLQHDAQDDRVFHDGVLCAGGSLLRLRNRTASGGASQFPDTTFPVDATLTLSQRGLVTPGSGALRYYSVFYRAPAATFCPPATANVTNGVRVIW